MRRHKMFPSKIQGSKSVLLQHLYNGPDFAINIENLTLSFGTEKILHDVSVQFAKGQIHGIIGRNGSGKTVLLKCICGFLKPDQGRIQVLGQDIGKDCDFAPNTGILIETPGFLSSESAYNNLRWLAELRGKSIVARVNNVLTAVGLDPSSKKHVGKFSLGMRQRLAIAQALLDDPELIILDEPMNALDRQGVADMHKIFLELRAKGKTILLASHYMQDIDTLCDDVYEMDQGTITKYVKI